MELSPRDCVLILEALGVRRTKIAERVSCPGYQISRIAQGSDPGYQITDALRQLVRERYFEVRNVFEALEARYGTGDQNGR